MASKSRSDMAELLEQLSANEMELQEVNRWSDNLKKALKAIKDGALLVNERQLEGLNLACTYKQFKKRKAQLQQQHLELEAELAGVASVLEKLRLEAAAYNQDAASRPKTHISSPAGDAPKFSTPQTHVRSHPSPSLMTTTPVRNTVRPASVPRPSTRSKVSKANGSTAHKPAAAQAPDVCPSSPTADTSVCSEVLEWHLRQHLIGHKLPPSEPSLVGIKAPPKGHRGSYPGVLQQGLLQQQLQDGYRPLSSSSDPRVSQGGVSWWHGKGQQQWGAGSKAGHAAGQGSTAQDPQQQAAYMGSKLGHVVGLGSSAEGGQRWVGAEHSKSKSGHAVGRERPALASASRQYQQQQQQQQVPSSGYAAPLVTQMSSHGSSCQDALLTPLQQLEQQQLQQAARPSPPASPVAWLGSQDLSGYSVLNGELGGLADGSPMGSPAASMSPKRASYDIPLQEWQHQQQQLAQALQAQQADWCHAIEKGVHRSGRCEGQTGGKAKRAHKERGADKHLADWDQAKQVREGEHRTVAGGPSQEGHKGERDRRLREADPKDATKQPSKQMSLNPSLEAWEAGASSTMDSASAGPVGTSTRAGFSCAGTHASLHAGSSHTDVHASTHADTHTGTHASLRPVRHAGAGGAPSADSEALHSHQPVPTNDASCTAGVKGARSAASRASRSHQSLFDRAAVARTAAVAAAATARTKTPSGTSRPSTNHSFVSNHPTPAAVKPTTPSQASRPSRSNHMQQHPLAIPHNVHDPMTPPDPHPPAAFPQPFATPETLHYDPVPSTPHAAALWDEGKPTTLPCTALDLQALEGVNKAQPLSPNGTSSALQSPSAAAPSRSAPPHTHNNSAATTARSSKPSQPLQGGSASPQHHSATAAHTSSSKHPVAYSSAHGSQHASGLFTSSPAPSMQAALTANRAPILSSVLTSSPAPSVLTALSPKGDMSQLSPSTSHATKPELQKVYTSSSLKAEQAQQQQSLARTPKALQQRRHCGNRGENSTSSQQPNGVPELAVARIAALAAGMPMASDVLWGRVVPKEQQKGMGQANKHKQGSQGSGREVELLYQQVAADVAAQHAAAAKLGVPAFLLQSPQGRVPAGAAQTKGSRRPATASTKDHAPQDARVAHVKASGLPAAPLFSLAVPQGRPAASPMANGEPNPSGAGSGPDCSSSSGQVESTESMDALEHQVMGQLHRFASAKTTPGTHSKHGSHELPASPKSERTALEEELLWLRRQVQQLAKALQKEQRKRQEEKQRSSKHKARLLESLARAIGELESMEDRSMKSEAPSR